MLKILRNSAYCNVCCHEIVSLHRHDFRNCYCKDEDTRIYVDGGHEYLRRLWGKNADYIDTSITEGTDE